MTPDVTSKPWLLVSASFAKTGGQDRANLALASFLARQGAELHVVAHRYGGENGGSRPNVAYHDAWRPLHSDLLGEPFLRWHGSRWARRLQERGAHVVVNGGNCAWPDVNWVHYVHAAYDRERESSGMRRVRWQLTHRQWLRDERRALGRARVVIANSRRTAQDLIEHLAIKPDRIHVVYYGTDAALFHPVAPSERAALRTAIGWPSDRPVALFIGALGDRRKGLDTTLRAWGRLRRSASTVPLLVVVGRGALVAELQRQVSRDGLDRDVRFLGFRSDVPSLVRAADLLVAATRYEAYGLGVHEALCCGLPAIVSARAGIAERYPDQLQHLLLPDPDDAEDLASRVATALTCAEASAQALAAFAQQLRARSWDDMARDIVDVAQAS